MNTQLRLPQGGGLESWSGKGMILANKKKRGEKERRMSF